MRVKLEPETAFIGKKFAYLFLSIIFGLNLVTFVWFFLFSKLSWKILNKDNKKVIKYIEKYSIIKLLSPY